MRCSLSVPLFPRSAAFREASGPSASLHFQDGRMLLITAPCMIGSNVHGAEDICLAGSDAHGVSGQHAQLEPAPGGIWVTDLNSTNGTAVGGQMLSRGERRFVPFGSWLTIGQLTLTAGGA